MKKKDTERAFWRDKTRENIRKHCASWVSFLASHDQNIFRHRLDHGAFEGASDDKSVCSGTSAFNFIKLFLKRTKSNLIRCQQTLDEYSGAIFVSTPRWLEVGENRRLRSSPLHSGSFRFFEIIWTKNILNHICGQLSIIDQAALSRYFDETVTTPYRCSRH